MLYDEARAGTNGLGTVVEERRPVAVPGPSTSPSGCKSFTCVGVPLVHPITGVLEGILDLTCLASETNELMLPLLLEASREVRERLVADSSASEQALLASFLRVTRRTRRPVVCLNDHIVISNDAARGLAPADYALLWEHFAAGGDRSAERRPGPPGALRRAGVRGALRAGRGGIGDGGRHRGAEAAGPARGARAGAGREAATTAAGPSLAGRSDAWRRVLAEIDVHAGHDHPVLVAGPRGVGKLRCALAVHARGRRRSRPVTVLDASLSVVDLDGQWIEPLRLALAEPDSTVVLRHLEALHERAVMATAALSTASIRAGRPPAARHPHRCQPAGWRPGALGDRFDVTMSLPPLRVAARGRGRPVRGLRPRARRRALVRARPRPRCCGR